MTHEHRYGHCWFTVVIVRPGEGPGGSILYRRHHRIIRWPGPSPESPLSIAAVVDELSRAEETE